MPTTRPRHTVTETPPVQEALDELRRELRGKPIDFPDLLIRGARDMAAELRRDDAETTEALKWLADRIRNREPLGDPILADEVKRLGLIEPDVPA